MSIPTSWAYTYSRIIWKRLMVYQPRKEGAVDAHYVALTPEHRLKRHTEAQMRWGIRNHRSTTPLRIRRWHVKIYWTVASMVWYSHYKDKTLVRPSYPRHVNLMPYSFGKHVQCNLFITHSTTTWKSVDLIPALHQSDCRIPNWVRAKTVHSSSTNHGQTTARFRSFFR